MKRIADNEAAVNEEAERLTKETIALIREAMERGEMTQRQLAQNMGVSEARISRLLNNERGNIELRTLAALARAAGIRFHFMVVPLP
jgi:transcriptional regulator with XRE-family HTH domain